MSSLPSLPKVSFSSLSLVLLFNNARYLDLSLILIENLDGRTCRLLVHTYNDSDIGILHLGGLF